MPTSCGSPARGGRRSPRARLAATVGREAQPDDHECYLELGGRYRHCDVYWAMHEVLKGKRLACHRAYWSLLGDAAILADPTLTVAERAELEQNVEAELCDRYVASLPHRVEREYPLDNRRADIFDRKRQLLIEAKAYADDVVALGAITQAMLYRTIANRDTEIVDRVAVLLPGEPSELARQVARTHVQRGCHLVGRKHLSARGVRVTRKVRSSLVLKTGAELSGQPRKHSWPLPPDRAPSAVCPGRSYDLP